MKPTVPKIEEDDGGLIFDDTLVNQPDTDESELYVLALLSDYR